MSGPWNIAGYWKMMAQSDTTGWIKPIHQKDVLMLKKWYLKSYGNCLLGLRLNLHLPQASGALIHGFLIWMFIESQQANLGVRLQKPDVRSGPFA
jgi:hypothetical protein